MRAQLRVRLVSAAFVIALTACGSGGGGEAPSITGAFPSGGSVVVPTGPPDAGSGALPGDAQTSVVEAEQPVLETEQPIAETDPLQTEPAAQASEAPATQVPSSTLDAVDGSDAVTLWWPWVLGALALVGLVLVVARRRRHGRSWWSQTSSLLDEVDQLTSHLAILEPEGLLAVAGADAMRLATMRASLVDLIGSAPNATMRTTLDGLSAPLAEIHAAVDAVALSADPSILSGRPSVAQLSTQLHTASASVRAGISVLR